MDLLQLQQLQQLYQMQQLQQFQQQQQGKKWYRSDIYINQTFLKFLISRKMNLFNS
jgi:hypothetical protein